MRGLSALSLTHLIVKRKIPECFPKIALEAPKSNPVGFRDFNSIFQFLTSLLIHIINSCIHSQKLF